MFTIKGCSLIRGVHYERFHCIIKQTDKYTYLGQTIITSNGKCDDEILKRIEIARGALNSMLKTLTARHISMKTKKRIIKAYVWSTLLHGCETWTITTRNMTKLQSFEMWAYRKMVKISWRENKTNEEVLTLADEQLYILPTIKKRKMTYFGHMIRRNNIHKLCSAHELCMRAEPCDWSAGAQGVTTMLRVSLRARRHTTK